MRNRALIFGLAALAIVAVVGLFSYNHFKTKSDKSKPNTGQTSQTATPPTPSQSTTQPNQTSEGTANQTYPVKVYFSRKPESDNDPSQVFAIARTSPDLGVGTFAVKELLKGPTDAEKNNGYFTTARLRSGDSNCGGQDFTLAISNGVATLQFCRPFDHLGVVADGQADSEIKATLKQFSTVQKVIILNRTGDCEFDLSGMNLCKQ